MLINANDFLNKIVLTEIKSLIENKKYYTALLILSHSIETLGALLDNKPFRAKMQSKRRFNYALKVLFPPEYKKLNHDYYLYNQLRNQMAHLLIPGSYIAISDYKNSSKHLVKDKNETLFINVSTFYNDVNKAAEKLVKMINEGKVKAVKLNINDEFENVF